MNYNHFINPCKCKKFTALIGTAIKTLRQAAEMKHDLSACILIPTLFSQVVPTNTVNLKYFYAILCTFSCNCIATHAQ